jgi:hypothetical protein
MHASIVVRNYGSNDLASENVYIFYRVAIIIGS